MGTDCGILVGDEFHELDRWYVFERAFESGVRVPRAAALQRMTQLLQSVTAKLPARPEYHQHWIQEATRRVEGSACEEVMLVHEHDYLKEVYGPRLQRALLDAGVAEGASWDRAARALIDLAGESGFSCNTRGSGEQFTASFALHGGRFGNVVWAFEIARGSVTRSALG